eukprot:CAMPEP_0201487612 /NCGR_PEP_ID=MMETSP0151_2-20130828/14084_1 /ASSEMBLY_ACC=CAM_ASM_000257 /TAXON_ID=200890 /ORGANISM="Paramoeba atlantica, Strain 621/1 / CCAP 1560/9" /LENGTH=514 /DNA_ID=CAMNT_0047872703 /DNA_START=238 /DNA_END=1782 /DNA_ORIENTATION=+
MKGAGIFAGGPYHCAKGKLLTAEEKCMDAFSPPDVTPYIDITNTRSSSGDIDPASNLASHQVYMFSGTKDTTVRQPVMDSLQTYLEAFMPSSSIVYTDNVKAAHTQPTDDPVNTEKCTVSKSPYLSDCEFDGAGMALNQIYGTLSPRNDGQLSGEYLQFDQSEFIGSNLGMSTGGWLFVPDDCAKGAACKLHVSFHGCLQNYNAVGKKYIENSGFSKWADTNHIIVLYPQTVSSHSNPTNPDGCWDWWGYNDASKYDTNSGAQAVAVKAMIDRIAGGAIQLSPPTNLAVGSLTNTSVSLGWDASISEVDGYNVFRNDTQINDGIVRGLSYVDQTVIPGSSYEYYVESIDGNMTSSSSNVVVVLVPSDGSVLSPPQNLNSTGTTSSSTTLTWDLLSGATAYNIYRNASLLTTTQSPPYTDSSLSSSTFYSYFVTGLNGSEEGEASESIDVLTLSDFVCTTVTSSNYDHIEAGRAYEKLGEAYALGSNQDMGLDNTFYHTTLSETSLNYYIIGNCP